MFDIAQLELTYKHAPEIAPVMRERADGCIVCGYLVRDSDVQNPLESTEGLGKIIDRRNLHRDENRNICRRLTKGPEGAYLHRRSRPCLLMLDVYVHSGEVWSLSGEGTQCRWDTTRRAGVWVPDKAAKDYIKYKAFRDCLPDGCFSSWDQGSAILTLPDGTVRGPYQSILTAIRAVPSILKISIDPMIKQTKEKEAAKVVARFALEEFNAWLAGDVWGVCVDTFRDGELVDEDACWGYVTFDAAKDELEATIKNVQKGK